MDYICWTHVIPNMAKHTQLMGFCSKLLKTQILTEVKCARATEIELRLHNPAAWCSNQDEMCSSHSSQRYLSHGVPLGDKYA